jgi:hypothetical protein
VRRAGAARAFHWFTAVVVVGALVLQVVVLVRDGVVPMPTRMLRLASYFTIQSNLLVACSAVTLALRPDRDGALWRVLRLDALVGITVTGVVYVTVLAPLQDLAGGAKVADAGLHYLSPVLAVAGWLAYGPRPRVTAATVRWALAWPIAWFAYTLVHGAIGAWYPYPFVDVGVLGYAVVVRNCAVVTGLLLGVAGAYLWGDHRLGGAPGPALAVALLPAHAHARGPRPPQG